MTRKLIIQIHTGHPNDYESVAYARRSWAEFDYVVEDLSVSDPQIGPKLEALLAQRSSEIFCFMSSNYYATKIRGNGQLLHTFTGIPLVILMHDHPVYFLNDQIPELDGSFVFPPGEDCVDFITKHYSPGVSPISRFGAPSAFDAGVPTFEQFESRRNVLLCPINLAFGQMTLDGYWNQIKSLPEPRRGAAIRLAEAAVTDCTVPLHIIAEGLPQLSDPVDAKAALKDQAIVLTFIKLWRRNKLVRALIDLPVLFSSEYVPSDLEFRYPGKFTLLSRAQTIPLYREYRFTLNANPLLTYVLHERILEPLFANSACITDRNVVLERFFSDERDILYFDYNDSRSVEKIARYFDDAEAAYGLTVNARNVRLASDNLHLLDPYRNLIVALEQRWSEREPLTPIATA
jgi:hypothetical protein